MRYCLAIYKQNALAMITLQRGSQTDRNKTDNQANRHTYTLTYIHTYTHIHIHTQTYTHTHTKTI